MKKKINVKDHEVFGFKYLKENPRKMETKNGTDFYKAVYENQAEIISISGIGYGSGAMVIKLKNLTEKKLTIFLP